MRSLVPTRPAARRALAISFPTAALALVLFSALASAAAGPAGSPPSPADTASAPAVARVSAAARVSSSTLLGDLSGDGVVSWRDARMLEEALLGFWTLPTTQVAVADTNRDAVVDSNDMVAILNGFPPVEVGEDVVVPEHGEGIDIVEVSTDTLVFEWDGAAPLPEAGDLIVSGEGTGFLGRAVSVDVSGTEVTLRAEPAPLGAAMPSGQISTTLYPGAGPGGAAQVDFVRGDRWSEKRRGRLSWDFSGTVIYEDENLTVDIPHGVLNFDSEINIDGALRDGRVEFFTASVSGTVGAEVDARAVASLAGQWSKTVPIPGTKWTGVFTQWIPTGIPLIPVVPVTEVVTIDLVASMEVNGTVEQSVESGFSGSLTMTAGASYREGDWDNLSEVETTISGRDTEWSAHGHVDARVTVSPRVRIKFYNLAGPMVGLEPYLKFVGDVWLNPPSCAWSLEGGLDAVLVFEIGILEDAPDTTPTPTPRASARTVGLSPAGVPVQAESLSWAFGWNLWKREILSGQCDPPTVTPTATPTPTSVPSSTPLPTVTPTATPTATSSPSATPVPTPTPGGDVTLTLPGGVTMELVAIPSGTFEMGRYPGEQDSDSDEDPRHTVTIGYGFHMGTTEVTQSQWEAVMGSNPSHDYGVGDDYPAYHVSWNDIVGSGGFLETLNAHLDATGQGLTVRLPSESEWEYCCRAGTTTRFHWGDDPSYTEIGDYAWYSGNNDPYGTKPVAGKLPNAWGLYDMSGNVWEWCQDDWYSGYDGAPTDGSPWGDGTASDRVDRGGNWYPNAQYCRSANRSGDSPAYRDYGVGFRLAAGH